MNDELKAILQKNKRYSGFELLETPVSFCELFKGRDFQVVQVHWVHIIDMSDRSADIVGFCGEFEWKDGQVKSLDGDSYNPEVEVLGYEFWDNSEEGITKEPQVPKGEPKVLCSGLDILVGDDW